MKGPDLKRNALAGASQQGAALIVALIFLAVLALLGITAAQTTQLEERMAGNTRDRDLAFQSAEAALRWASFNLAGLSAAAPALDEAAGNDATYWHAHDWTTATQLTAANVTINGVEAYPQIVVERRGTSDRYRVTARGVGASSNTVVLLQAEYQYP